MQAVGAAGLLSTRRWHGVPGRTVPKSMPTDDPFLRGYYAPIHSESDEPDLKIQGDMPKALHGTLYRNGPNPQFAPRGPYHWFAGDGMIHAFHLENGRVSYMNRWVRTPKWLVEHAAGEEPVRQLRQSDASPIRGAAKLNSTTANTNIVWHAGRLLALEEAHAPFLLDPASSRCPKGLRDLRRQG